MSTDATGAQLICRALEDAGVGHVFGLPGTQNVELFEALRGSSRLRTVVATHELSAAMMANGYHRASGRLAVLATIPGPGFTWAMTGLTEAALDSAALLHLVAMPAVTSGQRFQLQAIDQAAMAAPVTRARFRIDHADEIVHTLQQACAHATEAEPGPVLVEFAPAALAGKTVAAITGGTAPPLADEPDASRLDELAGILRRSQRCVVLAGQGCGHAGAALLRLVERLGALVVTTTSGRGAVPEDHPRSLGFELAGNSAKTLNAVVEAADRVLAIGCKFSHNGSRGFALRIPPERLMHVDASAEVLRAGNYPAQHSLRADAGEFLDAMLARLSSGPAANEGWSAATVADFRRRGRAEANGEGVQPRIHGTRSGRCADFFDALRRAMPRESILVLDSGQHAMLARLHYPVLCLRGLLLPTNLQSMGFGIGAAIGAALAMPGRPVVAVIGDGGLAMSGLELLTAVREGLALTVIVFVDGAYGLIRNQQIAATGHAFGTEFSGPDIEALAAAIGARHVRLRQDADTVLTDAIAGGGVTLVEVAVGDSLPMHWMRAKGRVKRALGPSRLGWLKRRLRGG